MSYPPRDNAFFSKCTNLHFNLLKRSNTKTLRLLRAAILEALLERTPKPAKPLRLDEERFRDLLARLEKAKPSQRRPSTQTLDERWQFATCRVSRTTYLKTKTVDAAR